MESIQVADLEVFLAVIRNESIAGAAQELRMSSPAVSTRIAALERKVGVQLLRRTARGSFTTAAGSQFRTYAKSCLDVLSQARRSLHTAIDDAITLAIPASLGNTLMGPALEVLSAAGVVANGRIEDTVDIIDHVADRTVDLGFVVNGVVPRSLTSERLTRSRMLPVVRPGHPLLEHGPLSVEDLRESPIAIYHWHTDAVEIGHLLGRSRRETACPTVFVGLPTAIVHLIHHKNYVGLIAEFAVADQLRREELVLLPVALPAWSVDVDLIYRPSSNASRAAETLTCAFGSLLPYVAVPPDPPSDEP
ncbi:LysR family transcriptional regulator [Mycobacterium sp. NPDC003449]